MRLLIFVDDWYRAASLAEKMKAERLHSHLSYRQRSAVIERFNSNPDGILVTTKTGITGWRCPADTQVLFHKDATMNWSMAEVIQADGRVGVL